MSTPAPPTKFVIQSAQQTKGVFVVFAIDPKPVQRSVFIEVMGPSGSPVDADLWTITPFSTALTGMLVTGGPLYTTGKYQIRAYMSVDDPSQVPPFATADFDYTA
jgi:hypothetical protein